MWVLDVIQKDANVEEKIRKKVLEMSLGRGINVHVLFQYRKIEEEDKSLMLTVAREGKVLLYGRELGVSVIQKGKFYR